MSAVLVHRVGTADPPSGRRVTCRLRAAAGRAVALGAATVAQAARDFGLSWPVVHAAFLHYATAVLPQEPEPVVALGAARGRTDSTGRLFPRTALPPSISITFTFRSEPSARVSVAC